jgi:NaMN:DMB phosphoribosyltransferase
MIQGRVNPELKNPVILVFAADHGISEEGVSPFPKEITHQMVMNFTRGGAGINVFTKQHGIGLKVIDSGVDYDFPEGAGIIDAKLARGTNNMLKEPAMSVELCREAIKRGREFTRSEFENGCNVIGFGEMGIGIHHRHRCCFINWAVTPWNNVWEEGPDTMKKGLKRNLKHFLKYLKNITLRELKKYYPHLGDWRLR